MIVRVLVIALFALMGRVIEDMRKLPMGPRGFALDKMTLRFIYECANLHLLLNLGMLGLAWKASLEDVWPLVAFLFVGAISKGLLSNHDPDSLSWGDKAMLFGLYVPNACGIGSIAFALFFLV